MLLDGRGSDQFRQTRRHLLTDHAVIQRGFELIHYGIVAILRSSGEGMKTYPGG
jgi:hypothetical protein